MKNWREEVKYAKSKVLQEVKKSSTATSPRLVVGELAKQGISSEAAKRAIWYLMDDGQIRWNHERKLEAANIDQRPLRR